MEAAYTGGNDYAYAVFIETFVALESGVGYGLTSCNNCILSIQVELAQLFAVEVGCGVVVLYFAGKLRFELGGVKVCNRARAAFALYGVVPRCGHVVADRGNGAETGYDNSF